MLKSFYMERGIVMQSRNTHTPAGLTDILVDECELKYSIETTSALDAHKQKCEDRINELVQQRTELYKERTDENCEKIKEQVLEIKAELGALRSELRMCKAIYEEAQHIAEKQRQAQELLQQAEKEVNANEHKRRSR